MRTLDDVALALELGATRVVLGTVAVRQPQIVADAVARFGAERIVVGIDARDGMVATHGWQETSALDALTVAQRMKALGVQRVVYTDIARDGTLTGVNLAATVALARASGLRGHRQRRRRLAGRHPRPVRPSSRRHRGRDRRAGAVHGGGRSTRSDRVGVVRST